MDEYRHIKDKWLRTAICFAKNNNDIFYSSKSKYSTQDEKLLRDCLEKEHPHCTIKDAPLSKLLNNVRTSAFRKTEYFKQDDYDKSKYHLISLKG